jgi:putative tryptophan/tyrosine transport system substrate-binding protein
MGIRRREVSAGLASAAVSLLTAGRLAAREPIRLVALVIGPPLDDPEVVRRLASLKQGLAERGWIEGDTVRFELRSTGGDQARRQALVSELVALRPDVILTASSVETEAVLNLTRTIPVIFVTAADPVASGFVRSLERPGGNASGLVRNEAGVGNKWLELLLEIAPGVRRIAALFNPDTAPGRGQHFIAVLEAAGREFGVAVEAVAIRDVAEIEPRLRALPEPGITGLILLPDSYTYRHVAAVVEAINRRRLPAMYPYPRFVQQGGLIAYSAASEQPGERLSTYVDLVLRGTPVGDLPVQYARRHELILNMRAAEDLGLTVPATLLARADTILE